MSELTPEEATGRAGAELGLDPSTPARAWRTRRLDRPGEVYYLVVFGEEHAASAVATVDAASGEIRTSARLPGLRPHLTVDARRAAELAGLGDSAQVALVWRPCRASRSPFYPLWEVRAATRTVYVDQQGHVWQELDPTL